MPLNPLTSFHGRALVPRRPNLGRDRTEWPQPFEAKDNAMKNRPKSYPFHLRFMRATRAKTRAPAGRKKVAPGKPRRSNAKARALPGVTAPKKILTLPLREGEGWVRLHRPFHPRKHEPRPGSPGIRQPHGGSWNSSRPRQEQWASPNRFGKCVQNGLFKAGLNEKIAICWTDSPKN